MMYREYCPDAASGLERKERCIVTLVTVQVQGVQRHAPAASNCSSSWDSPATPLEVQGVRNSRSAEVHLLSRRTETLPLQEFTRQADLERDRNGREILVRHIGARCGHSGIGVEDSPAARPRRA